MGYIVGACACNRVPGPSVSSPSIKGPGDEAMKFIAHVHTHTIDFLRLALAGGMAGAGFWTTVYPVDVVKSRIQVTNPMTGLHHMQCTCSIRLT